MLDSSGHHVPNSRKGHIAVRPEEKKRHTTDVGLRHIFLDPCPDFFLLQTFEYVNI